MVLSQIIPSSLISTSARWGANPSAAMWWATGPAWRQPQLASWVLVAPRRTRAARPARRTGRMSTAFRMTPNGTRSCRLSMCRPRSSSSTTAPPRRRLVGTQGANTARVATSCTDGVTHRRIERAAAWSSNSSARTPRSSQTAVRSSVSTTEGSPIATGRVSMRSSCQKRSQVLASTSRAMGHLDHRRPCGATAHEQDGRAPSTVLISVAASACPMATHL